MTKLKFLSAACFLKNNIFINSKFSIPIIARERIFSDQIQISQLLSLSIEKIDLGIDYLNPPAILFKYGLPEILISHILPLLD